MLLNVCDGSPVNYSSPDSTGNNPRRACTTQSPGRSGDYSNLEDFYGSSRALKVVETSQPSSHPALQQACHLPPAISTATQTYRLPHIHSAVSTSPAQGMWPTPPATSCDDFDDYTCQESPTTAACGVPVSSFSARSSATSPVSWSSPEAQQLAFQQSVWKTQDILPRYDIHICTSNMPMEGQFHQQMASSPYANSNYFGSHNNSSSSTTSSNVDPDSFMATEAPAMTPDMADSAVSDCSPSPLPNHDFGGGYPFEDDDDLPTPASQGEAEQEGDDANKVEEPYAQLIFRALMSKDPHAMTLQEIYQWVRENSDKAKTENKGWQNSVRHNLSMNAAFVKPDRRAGSGDAVTDTGEPRKSTEWVLEDWAVRDGVQSTTRYRKGNPSRRGGSGSHSRSQHNQTLSARASSGRKGGLTTSKLKGTTRAALRRQQYGAVVAPQLPGRYNYYANPARNEPVTPPDASAGDILFPGVMHGPQAPGTNNGQGYYYGPSQSQHRHLHHAQHGHPQPNLSGYRLENVAGVYEPSPIPPTTGPADPAQLSSHLPTGFNNLFADDIGEELSESSARVANLSYDWGDSGSYQP